MSEERIERDINVNGLTLHVTEQGSGPLVLLCHGWPELAYSWRYQVSVLARAGYRVVAPDMRGYGGSSVPVDVADYAITDLVGDMVALVAALGETRACIIGHDWGANVAWSAALMRPDLFQAVAALSVPHRPRNASGAPLTLLRASGNGDFYWFYFNREGLPEAEFERDIRSSVRKVLFAGSGDATPESRMSLTLAPGCGFLDHVTAPETLPAWLNEADIDVFAAAFRRNGLRGPFNWYRNIDRNWALLAPFQGVKVTPSALFIAGTRDVVIDSPMGRGALENLAASVPNLREILLIEGGGHWIQQERPAEVNAALLAFLAADYPA
jgi:pimeloyl-ACP methyl ester carboxylesterase